MAPLCKGSCHEGTEVLLYTELLRDNPSDGCAATSPCTGEALNITH